MGCDIHAVFQKRVNGGWQDVASTWEQDRHYFLFSWLADVRNGYGFAGVRTYTPVKPISKPRGLPDDFVGGENHPTTLDAFPSWRLKYMEEKEKLHLETWLGDHSHSWLTAEEILAAPIPSRNWKTGIVSRAWFDAWDGHTPPTEYCGGKSGLKVRVAESPIDVGEDTTDVRIYWIQPDDSLTYFIDEVRRLKTKHGDVRMVFGFDS